MEERKAAGRGVQRRRLGGDATGQPDSISANNLQNAETRDAADLGVTQGDGARRSAVRVDGLTGGEISVDQSEPAQDSLGRDRWLFCFGSRNANGPVSSFNLGWRRNTADKLSKRWKALGFFGLFCLLASTASFAIFHRLESLTMGSHGDRGTTAGEGLLPQWFQTREVPMILRSYSSTHDRILRNMMSRSSGFVVYEMPANSTSVSDTFLGLISSFMLAIVTERALLIQWTETWKPELPPQASMNTSKESKWRRLDLGDILLEPGFQWKWESFKKEYELHGKTIPKMTKWDPVRHIDQATCQDLKIVFGDQKFVKITSQQYFMPLLMVNPHYSKTLETALEYPMAFADMFNFLLRPTEKIRDSMERFRLRYLDGNTVVGIELMITPGGGQWNGDGFMPDKQQDLFFTTASTLVKPDDDGSNGGVVDDSIDGQFGSDSSYGGSVSSGSGVGLVPGNAVGRSQTSTSTKNGGVVFLVVTDSQAQVQTNFQRLEASDQAVSAGIVAILSAIGEGKDRLMMELQQLWLLGYADVVLTTPGSRTGIVATSRTHKFPRVVLDETLVHEASVAYPCLASFGDIQHATCFVPSMLTKIPPDSLVPCS